MFNFFLTSVVFQKYYNSLQQKSLYRSRAVSPVEQGTIDCEYLAYFGPKKMYIKEILCNFLVRKKIKQKTCP